jgi:hypothetical protein
LLDDSSIVAYRAELAAASRAPAASPPPGPHQLQREGALAVNLHHVPHEPAVDQSDMDHGRADGKAPVPAARPARLTTRDLLALISGGPAPRADDPHDDPHDDEPATRPVPHLRLVP